MAVHELKCWPEPFRALWHGSKTHEVRFDDRGFKVGDTLVLRQWDPKTRRYNDGVCGELYKQVTYISRGPDFGLPEGLVVMSVK